MAEASAMKQKKLQELATEELKIKMEIEQLKARVKVMEGEEQKFKKMANQEDLDNELSEKLQFPQEDLNYLWQKVRLG